MSSSKLDLLKISCSNIWNMVNFINILGTYICSDGVRQQHAIQTIISQMDHPHISVTPTPPFSMACTNLSDDLFIWEILARLPTKYLMTYKEICPSCSTAIDDAGFV
jgi:hypothetical protein